MADYLIKVRVDCVGMRTVLLAVICSGGVAVTSIGVGAQARQFMTAGSAPNAPLSAGGDLPTIPPPPGGKSTIFGGEIRNIDSLRDELTLGVFGGHPLRMRFDERTQVYRDGKRIPLRELKETGHASVETTLDGTKLFALTIHILSSAPEGEYSGRILDYDANSGRLTVAADQSPEPLKLFTQQDTLITRKGQSTFASASSGPSDLAKGSLISVHFAGGDRQGAVVTQIDVLAVPGAAFVFSGSITSIDMHSGLLVLLDPRDDQTHRIIFSSTRLPALENIHVGDQTRVAATYDGTNYIVNEISVTKP